MRICFSHKEQEKQEKWENSFSHKETEEARTVHT